jgi:hypothetical protein
MTHSGPSRVGSDRHEGLSPDCELIFLKGAVETCYIITKNRAVAIPKGISQPISEKKSRPIRIPAVSRSGCPTHGVMCENAEGRLGVGFGQAFQGINSFLDVPASALPRIVKGPGSLE